MHPTKLINHINKFVTLDQKDIVHIKSAIICQTFEKNEALLDSRKVCRYNYFIVNGCLRMYVVTEDGRDQTIQFAIEDWWLTDYTSFEGTQPSEYNIKAVEKSQIILIRKDKLEMLFEKVPLLERYFRMITQKAYAAALYRISLIYNQSKRERYLNFIERFPDFAQRVPQYLLSSFLGISAEYISEIRNDLN